LSIPNFYFPHDAFTYLCSNFSSFVINFHKMCASYWYKGLHWGNGWHLSLAFFMDTTTYCWNDTTCSPWDTSCRIFLTLIQSVRHLSLCQSMGHPLDKLELLLVGELSSLDDHLKLRITCGTTIWCARYHLYECYL
jgi:hypothetical protein